MHESSLRRKIKQALEAEGAIVYVTHQAGFGQKGAPDLLVGYQGRLIVMEVKRPGEKPTALQTHRLKQAEAAGCLSGAVHSVEEALLLLFLKPDRPAAVRVAIGEDGDM